MGKKRRYRMNPQKFGKKYGLKYGLKQQTVVEPIQEAQEIVKQEVILTAPMQPKIEIAPAPVEPVIEEVVLKEEPVAKAAPRATSARKTATRKAKEVKATPKAIKKPRRKRTTTAKRTS
jgi:hypothetical protein